jgi:hypothetical protein
MTVTETTVATVQEFLKSLKVGEGQYKDGLTIFTLYSDIRSVYEYITLDEALKEDILTVKEIGSGTVPEISVLNKGKKDVFIMDGEELVGAKQNRMVNISLIVPAESEIKIPVSCVEQGRWHHTSEKFYASDNISYANLRKKQKASVMYSMRVGGFHANQGEVWDNIEAKMDELSVNSSTGAMSDIYEKEKGHIDIYKDIFKHVEGQIGAVFAIGKTIFGMDVFDKEDTCRKLMPKIIRSYVMEILYGDKRDKQPEAEDVKEFLKTVAESQFSPHKSPGAGTTVSITGKKVAGTSLVMKDTVVHTAIFNKIEQEKQEERYSYMRYPSERRNINIIREEL